MVFVPSYILILGATIVVDYFAGIFIEKSHGHKRKLYLVLSLITNIGFLAFFKYWNFFAANVNELAQLIGWNYSIEALHILLPVGLSFHTFQAMSYTIEVYKGRQKAERHFGIYSLYVMFFPQLVAGPIERPQHLIHQFYQKHFFEYERVTSGIRLVVWGLFKKVVIADRLAVLVNTVFQAPHNFNGFQLTIAAVFFLYQLYCDFSGYTDIARGSARILGFELIENFNRPFISKSIAEYWRRWHISLSFWLRDYVYYPIAFKREGSAKTKLFLALLVTFFLSGLWHGAGWTYIIWGTLYGLYICISVLTKPLRDWFVKTVKLNAAPKLHGFLQIAFTFALVVLTTVFFRADSVQNGWYIVSHWFVGWGNLASLSAALKAALSIGLGPEMFGVAASGIIFLEIAQYIEGKSNLKITEWLGRQAGWVKWPVYYAIILAILFFGAYAGSQFIYFQF